DDDFGEYDFEGFEGDKEVWEVNEDWLMAPVIPTLVPCMPPPSTYKVGGPSTVAAEGHTLAFPAPGFPEYPHSITIGEIGPSVSAIEGQVQVMASQMVQAMGRLEQVQALQATVQWRGSQIQQLQTMVSEMSGCKRTLMQCILGMDRRLADLEKRPPRPQ
ncbi:hypothetical protein Tco_0182484, partial [Tanacetum coccineum]